jgi:putative tryptophan/tyrosine transport system substrate-binding protein
VDALMTSDEGQVLLPQRPLLVQLVQQLRLPAIFPYREFAENGGLMSYSSDLKDAVLRLAAQIAEILRGTNPGDIPYSQAVRFHLVVNLKTAKELGIEIPAELVAGATAVIE